MLSFIDQKAEFVVLQIEKGGFFCSSYMTRIGDFEWFPISP